MQKLDAILFTLAFYLAGAAALIAVFGLPPNVETEIRALLEPAQRFFAIF